MDSARSGRTRHRPALIVLVVVAAAACLALAWWQWSRYESSSGTAQNLGYALQWPAFAAAVVYAYRRFVVLENDAGEVEKLSPRSKGAVEIPDGILPERQSLPSAESLIAPIDPGADAGLREYNRYLAELNRADAPRRGVDDPEPTSR